MSEPNSPGQPKASEPNNSAGTDNSTVQFDSTMSTKAGQPQDYFAEQNKEREEKKKKTGKIRNKLLIVGGVLLLVVVVVIVLWLVVFKTRDNEAIVMTSGSIEEINELRDLANNAFEPSVNVNNNGEITLTGDIEAAAEIFQSALERSQNRDYHNQIHLSAMSFYYYNGYYNELVEHAREIDPEGLSYNQKVMFYNLAALGYEKAGDMAKSTEYMDQAITLNILGEQEGE